MYQSFSSSTRKTHKHGLSFMMTNNFDILYGNLLSFNKVRGIALLPLFILLTTIIDLIAYNKLIRWDLFYQSLSILIILEFSSDL